MELLLSLGINKTIFYQFTIFLFTYICMYFLMFKPYFKAYGHRQANTVGGHEANERILEETQELQVEFESKTRAVNLEYKKIYSEARTKALEEYDAIVQGSRNEAKSILEKAQIDINSELNSAQAQLKAQLSQISTQIKAKVLN